MNLEARWREKKETTGECIVLLKVGGRKEALILLRNSCRNAVATHVPSRTSFIFEGRGSIRRKNGFQWYLVPTALLDSQRGSP